MKRITKIVSALALISSLSLFAQTEEPVEYSMGYFDIGLGPFPAPIPSFGVGYRKQIDHHGGDISLQVSTISVATQIKGNLLYHYYFKPNLSSQLYAGGGLGVSSLFADGRVRGYFSPEFVVGKQYQNETGSTRFLQAQISWPTCRISKVDAKPFLMPLVVFSYGIGF